MSARPILKRRTPETGVLEGGSGTTLMHLSRILPGDKRFVKGRLHFGVYEQNVELIKQYLPDLDWTPYAPELVQIEERKALAIARVAAQHGTLADDTSGYRYQTQPYEHQRRAFLLSRDATAYALLMEMGTGKTKVSIDTTAYLFEKGEVNCCIVIAPNGVHSQWINEQLEVHWPEHLERVDGLWLNGGVPPTLGDNQPEACLFVAFNIESLSRAGRARKSLDHLLATRKCIVFIDESSKIKNPASGRSKYLTNACEHVPYKRILTGTPITQGPQDFYSQFDFLDHKIIGHRSFTVFKHEYCIMGGFKEKQVLGHKNIPALQARIAPYAFVVKKKDCLDLPEKVYITRDVEFEQEQATHYHRMLEELYTQFESGEIISASIALSQMIRLQQICGGFLQQDGVTQRLDNNRVDACEEVIEEAQGKTIIFARFKEEHAMLEERFPGRSVSYHGGIKTDQRVENIRLFRDPNGADIFIANQQSAGLGLDLSCASNVIYYSNTWSLEERLQSEDRAHRIGQKNNVTYTDFRIKGTIDDRVFKALMKKKNVADLTIEGLRFLVFGEGESGITEAQAFRNIG